MELLINIGKQREDRCNAVKRLFTGLDIGTSSIKYWWQNMSMEK